MPKSDTSGAYAAQRDVPVIETTRLMLRAHRAEDFDACAAMWADPAVTRFIGGKASSPTETWSKMLRYRGLWSLVGFGYWAIEERATGRFIGEVGFADFKRNIEPSLAGIPEMGWGIVAAAHRQGFATEAVRAALAWADRRFETGPTTCIISPENVGSLRVAENAGFREFARTLYNGDPVIIFRR